MLYLPLPSAASAGWTFLLHWVPPGPLVYPSQYQTPGFYICTAITNINICESEKCIYCQVKEAFCPCCIFYYSPCCRCTWSSHSEPWLQEEESSHREENKMTESVGDRSRQQYYKCETSFPKMCVTGSENHWKLLKRPFQPHHSTLSFTTFSVKPDATIFCSVFSLLCACRASFAEPWPNLAM